MKDISTHMYIELDTLLDTRFALLSCINEDIFKKWSSGKIYQNRITDTFDGLSSTIFNIFYKKRNKVLLTQALPTKIFEVVNMMHKQGVANKFINSDSKLYVNVYPYSLEDSEKDQIISMCEGLMPDIEISIIYLDPVNEVTPEWVDSHVRTLFLYNGVEWLNKQMLSLRLESNPLVNCSVISPTILNRIPRNVKIDSEYFKMLNIANSPLVDMKFIDTMYFSIMSKK